MMVLRHGGAGGGFLAGKQVVPVDYEAEVSQRLLEATLSNDLKSVNECVADPFVDVNYVGVVCLKVRKTEVILHEESPTEVRVFYEEFRTDVTALFIAVHNGNVALVRKLLSLGADVNQQLFKGFAITAAVREGHLEILRMLVKAGASQPACEEALLEASIHGRANLGEMLMGSDLIRPHIATHALLIASCRGFIDMVDALLKCGVDMNATDRVLLQLCKPCLHTNIDCTALVAAIVSRQISSVRCLLEAGIRTNVNVQLGAWSWDVASGEEFRVGVGLARPYPITWCAVEYFESTGAILHMLLQYISPNIPHYGRTVLHHAILCSNMGAIKVLLRCGAHIETPVKTTQFRPIHIAARLGYSTILQCLVDSGCDLNSKTETGETALMICAKYKQEECLKVLTMAGADFGLVNISGQSVSSIAWSHGWYLEFQHAMLDVIRNGKVPASNNIYVFSPLLFVARSGDVLGLKALIGRGDIDLDKQDEKGFSAVMVTAKEGHVDAFRLLVYAGADVKICNKSGETAITLFRLCQNKDLFEKVMLEFALKRGNCIAGGFYALHCAARRGDLDAVKLLASKGYDVNAYDGDGYTALMLGAKEGHGSTCEFLISHGAELEIKNANGETALSLARNNGHENGAEYVIMNAMARKLVLNGSPVQKHTKRGKGAPHAKIVQMLEHTGVLRWGNSSRRNVICHEAEVGPSLCFEKNRKKKGDANEPGIFRVKTTKNKEVHFVCEGGHEMAKLWVRGIKLVTREAISVNEKIEEVG